MIGPSSDFGHESLIGGGDSGHFSLGSEGGGGGYEELALKLGGGGSEGWH